jgi:hypothetical protein
MLLAHAFGTLLALAKNVALAIRRVKALRARLSEEVNAVQHNVAPIAQSREKTALAPLQNRRMSGNGVWLVGYGMLR